MARQQRNELAAGIFVIVGGAAAIAVAVWLGGLSLGGRHAYLTAPADIGDTSIRVDSPLRVGSVQVGKVDRITPGQDWRSFTYRIRLSGDLMLRQDARVLANAPTLGGAGSLTAVSLGSPEAPPADRDHPAALTVGANPLVANMLTEIGYGPDQRQAVQQAIAHVNQTAQSLHDLTLALQSQLAPTDQAGLLGQAQATASSLRRAAESVESQILVMQTQLDPNAPQSMLSKLHRSLDHTAQATGEAAAMIHTVRPSVESTAADLADTARQVNTYTKTDLASMLAALRASSTNILTASADLRDLTGTARQTVHLERGRLEQIMANLTQVSENLKATSREVHRRPWLLLAKSDAADLRSRNIEAAAAAFADGAARLDAAMNRLQGLTRASDHPVAPDDPQLSLIRQGLDESFEKFTAAEQALWKELAE